MDHNTRDNQRENKIKALTREILKKIEDEGLTANEAELLTHSIYKNVVEINRENSSKMPFTSC